MLFLTMLAVVCAQTTGSDVYRVKLTDKSEEVLRISQSAFPDYLSRMNYYKHVVDSALLIATPDAYVLAMKAAIFCDLYDQLNCGGNPDKLIFHQVNLSQLKTQCAQVIDAGLVAYGKAQYQRACDCFTLYLERTNTSLFAADLKAHDPYFNQCAYYCVQAAYKANDMNTVDRYLEAAQKDGKYGFDARLLKLSLQRDRCVSKQDSMQYLYSLQKTYRQYPREDRIFNMIVQLYMNPTFSTRLRPFLADEVRLDKKNKIKWAMLGEVEMSSGNWDDALSAYRNALQLDSQYVEVLYNMGICYYSKTDYSQAAQMLERCRRYDPDRKRVQWAVPLYKVYYAMKDEEKARELLPLVQ